MVDELNYDLMVQEALRRIVRDALTVVQNHGLADNHHFYITFRTNRSDVSLPPYLREKHPEDITIVLQHQFYDLAVYENHFEVTLSFNDKHERLKVPYGAITSFMDPSVKFGLQFVPQAENYAMDPKNPTPEGAGPTSSKVVDLAAFRQRRGS